MKTINWYARALYQRVHRFIKPRYSRQKVTLFRYTSALGDALLLTTLAREIKKRNPSAKIHVVTGLPVIFERNPDVDLITYYDGSPVPGLGKHLIRYENKFPWTKHILHHCAECVDIKDDIELRTYIYPAKEDYNFAKNTVGIFKKAPVLICRTAGPRTDKKNWPDYHWNSFLTELLREHPVIEIGGHSVSTSFDDSSNYLNLTGKTTLHQTAALMTESALLICPVTGLLHLASAFNLLTICILGGSEPSSGTQYPQTHYVENRPVCANCYEKGPCTNNFLCLTEITPRQVMEKVYALLPK